MNHQLTSIHQHLTTNFTSISPASFAIFTANTGAAGSPSRQGRPAGHRAAAPAAAVGRDFGAPKRSGARPAEAKRRGSEMMMVDGGFRMVMVTLATS